MATTRALGTIFLLIGILAATVSLATPAWRNLHVQYGQGRGTAVQPVSDGVRLGELEFYRNGIVIRLVLATAALGTGLGSLALGLEIVRIFHREGQAANRILVAEFVSAAMAAPSQLGSIATFAYFFIVHASPATIQAEVEPRLSHLLNLVVVGANGWRASPGYSFYLMLSSLICHAMAACVLCYELCHAEGRRRQSIVVAGAVAAGAILQRHRQHSRTDDQNSSAAEEPMLSRQCSYVLAGGKPQAQQLQPPPDLFITEDLPVPHCLVRRSRSSSINSQRSATSVRSSSIVSPSATAGAAAAISACPHRRCSSVRSSPGSASSFGGVRRASRASAGRSREASISADSEMLDSAMLLPPHGCRHSHHHHLHHHQHHQHYGGGDLLTVPQAQYAIIQYAGGGGGAQGDDGPEPVNL